MTRSVYNDAEFVEAYAETNSNFPKLAARLERLTRDMEGECMLDLGCGHGRDTRMMAKLCCKAVGVDYSEEMLRKAVDMSQGNGRIEYVLADMRSIGDIFDEDSFALGWCTASLIHVPVEETPGVLRGLGRVTKPGTISYVGIKGGETGTKVITEIKYGREISREFSLWRAEDFDALARSVGFEVAGFDREWSGVTAGKPTEWLNFELRNKKASR